MEKIKGVRCIGFVIGICLVITALAVGCGQINPTATSTSTAIPSTRTAAETETSTQTISSTSSGTIEFSDGSKVVLSAGALTLETQISVTKPKTVSDLEEGFAGYMRVEPESLTLSKEAIVTLKYDPNKISDTSKISVLSYSASNPRIDLGSEISYFQFITPEAINTAESTVSFKTSHFSVFSYFWEYPAYLVLGLPGRYLKKGDLIYVLTNAMTSTNDGAWFPGHTGLYLGTTNPDLNTNDGSTVIESTPIAPSLGQNQDGVQYSTLDNFKTLSGQHIFIGARRPKGITMTKDHRKAIAKYAIDKIGVGFRDVGGGSFLNISDSTKISCVGFTELAYSAGGINIVPEYAEALLYPIRQFNRTEPVSEITVIANEKVDIPVYGLVRGGLRYSKDDKNYSVTASSTSDVFSSGGATFNRILNGKEFVWTPKLSDIGKTVIIKFELSGSGLTTLTQNLAINVSGSYFPMITGAQYTYSDTQNINTTYSTGKPTTSTTTNTVIRTVTGGSTNEITETIEEVNIKYKCSEASGYWVYNKLYGNGVELIEFSPYWRIMPTDLQEPQTTWGTSFDMKVASTESTLAINIGAKESDVVGDDFETITAAGVAFEKSLKINRTLTLTKPDQTGVVTEESEDGKTKNTYTVTVKTDTYTTAGTEYYAPGVGLIRVGAVETLKQSAIRSDGKQVTSTKTTTINRELISYSIP